ncbi:helix-turn-helix domain-containing protein [Labrys monachus]|uniref:Transcriptional regulator with XRE-family HTH domain n=1 Tax=Labrys monachus TaxID=217067 RepID=A0ABU0FLF8_9HYPH|nr:XRE family transcriptional regulator [Labrys monachus]MDQ0395440.1 transcriptional regulator with XRE-family HTH domain [Labrys monachus]
MTKRVVVPGPRVERAATERGGAERSPPSPYRGDQAAIAHTTGIPYADPVDPEDGEGPFSDAFPTRNFPSGAALAGQDPHALGGARDNTLEVAIGREVRAFRNKLGITVSDLAAATGLSLGMLSKIENGVTSPSLTTLQTLSRALGVPVTAFFRRFEERRDAVFVRAGEGLLIERRGTRAGHQYRLLGHTSGHTGRVVVEPYVITLTEGSDVFPLFQHSGLEFIYMLEGEVVYRHADKLYTLQPGDSLFFDADAPHGPDEMRKLPIRFLSIISYARDDE